MLEPIDLPDVCDFDRLYDVNSGYVYSLPESLLKEYLSGKAFDHEEEYTIEELCDLKADIRDIYKEIRERDPIKNNVAVLTAGAPGAGKTTLMRQELQRKNEAGFEYAYICPDDVCLKKQKRTYVADLKDVHPMTFEALHTAYTKWRPGSNAASHLILGNLIRDQFSFYFGVTSTSPFTWIFCDFLKQQNYQLKFLHISAPDNVRWGSIKERDKEFVQTTEEDTIEKGKLLPQRIMDTYLKFADEIEFYYRDEVKENAIFAARWTKEGDGVFGGLEIVNLNAYNKIKELHDDMCDQLERSDLLWENTVEAHSFVR